MSKKRHENRLISEKSPYLLQHAYNPVDWFPWGNEAFEKAQAESKPIFLSIGYSTCHWCHVMERESFEDEEVAAMMNEGFVSIKVDREERPDIDQIYMAVCQMLTGGGGWPLTIIMTPDKKPFFAGTYFPKETLPPNRIGMMDLLPRVADVYKNRRDELIESADKITRALQTPPALAGEIDESSLRQAYRLLAERFDDKNGGFGTAPKFPTAHNLSFLLRFHKRTGDPAALDMVEKTLSAMRAGGIYDHVGYGFHRYATDEHWLVPHFEKMLYDQALIAVAYIEAYQVTGKKEYADTAKEIFSYVLRDMTSPGGGFYSAEDADSEGVEGKFYLWTASEIRGVLDAEVAELVIKTFNARELGNFRDEATGIETGANILHLNRGDAYGGVPLKVAVALKKLFDAREKRVHPFKDDKILTDWNGLMIAALAKGARVFGLWEYAGAAERAVAFVMKNMRGPDGALLHRFRDGEAALPAHLDDYAFLIWGLIELYESTFKVGYLKSALELNEYLIGHFWDDKNGGFYFTAGDGENIARMKEIYDGAVPSGNSVAALNLLRLGRISANSVYEKMARDIFRVFGKFVSGAPHACTQLMQALDFAVGRSCEVVVAGLFEEVNTSNMVGKLGRMFSPNMVVIFKPTDIESPEIGRIAEYTKDMIAKNGKPTAYVCCNYKCDLPTDDVSEMLDLIKS